MAPVESRGGGRRGGAGGDFLAQFFGGRPCDHAATSSNSSSLMACQFIDRVVDVVVVGERRVPTVLTVRKPSKFCRSWSLFLTARCGASQGVAYVPVTTQRQVPTV